MNTPIKNIPDVIGQAIVLGRSPSITPVVVRVQESANLASYVEVPIKEVIETSGGNLALVVEVTGCCPSCIDPLDPRTWPGRAV